MRTKPNHSQLLNLMDLARKLLFQFASWHLQGAFRALYLQVKEEKACSIQEAFLAHYLQIKEKACITYK